MAIEYTDSQPSGLETAMRRCKEGAAFIETRPSCHQCGAADATVASQHDGQWRATCRSCSEQDDARRLVEFRQGLAKGGQPFQKSTGAKSAPVGKSVPTLDEPADLGGLALAQARLRLARQR